VSIHIVIIMYQLYNNVVSLVQVTRKFNQQCEYNVVNLVQVIRKFNQQCEYNVVSLVQDHRSSGQEDLLNHCIPQHKLNHDLPRLEPNYPWLFKS
jgi:hypothetical protein